MTKKQIILSVVVPLLASIITIVGTPIATIIIIDHRDESKKEVNTFRNDVTIFEQVTANYVRSILDDEKPDRTARNQLTDNLQAQLRDLPSLGRYLPTADHRLTIQYSQGISDLLETIPKVTDTLSMREFWERTSKLLVLRNEILEKLPG